MCDEPTATPDVALSSIQSQLPSSRSEAKKLESKHYFTGRPCSRGHTSKRHTACGKCLSCGRIDVANYNARNPEKLSLRDSLRTKEQIKFYNDRRSKEKIRAYNSRRDKEKMRLATKLRRQNDPSLRERESCQQRNWRAKNPEKVRVHLATRRAIKANASGSHTVKDIQEIFLAQKGKCAYFRRCETSIKSEYHVDHIISLSKGGSDSRSNLQLLCPPCNCRKNAKDPIIFAQEIGFLL